MSRQRHHEPMTEEQARRYAKDRGTCPFCQCGGMAVLDWTSCYTMKRCVICRRFLSDCRSIINEVLSVREVFSCLLPEWLKWRAVDIWTH